MSAEDVDEYLRRIEEPKRSTLEALRRTILEIVPDAEQVISYRVPAFRIDGQTVAGFAAFRDHLSYLPFSGSVLLDLAGELQGYTMTKSALHFSRRLSAAQDPREKADRNAAREGSFALAVGKRHDECPSGVCRAGQPIRSIRRRNSPARASSRMGRLSPSGNATTLMLCVTSSARGLEQVSEAPRVRATV